MRTLLLCLLVTAANTSSIFAKQPSPDKNNWLDTYINNPNWGIQVFFDDFTTDSSFWRQVDNQRFRVQLVNDRLEIERKDPVNSRACMWYGLPVEQFSIQDDYRIKLDFSFIPSEILTPEMDFMWGNKHDPSDILDVKMVKIGADGGVLFTHIHKHRNPMYMNHYQSRHSEVVHTERNQILIERVGPKITLFINGTEIRSFPARHGNTTEHHSIGFRACSGAEWALNSIEIRARESRSLSGLMDAMLEAIMENITGSRVPDRLFTSHPGYNRVSKNWKTANSDYLISGQVFYQGYSPSIVMLAGLKGEHSQEIAFFHLLNLDFSHDSVRGSSSSNLQGILFPQSMRDIVTDDTPETVIQWLEQNTSIIYEIAWGSISTRGGDLQWRLNYPLSREFVSDIADYIAAWSGLLHWTGELFLPIEYNTNNHVVERSRIKLYNNVSMYGSSSYFWDRLGEPTGEFEEEMSCVDGLYHLWDGIEVDISNPAHSYISRIDFKANPEIWITIFDEFVLSERTTIHEFLKIMPSFRVLFENRVNDEILIVPFYFTIPYESSHWLRFENGKLVSYNYAPWC